MWWHTRRKQIRSSSETDESIYIGGGVSSVEYWLSWSAGRGRMIVVTLDGLFRVKLKTADYPHHSPLSPSLLLPCVTVCHQIPFPLYHTRVNMVAFRLHRHPFSISCLYHAWMVLSVGESFAYSARNVRCIVTTDLIVWYSNTQNDFSLGAAIFSLYTHASPSVRNVNCDEKQVTGKKFFELFLPSVQVT